MLLNVTKRRKDSISHSFTSQLSFSTSNFPILASLLLTDDNKIQGLCTCMGEIVALTPPGKADVPPETSKLSVVSHVLASCLYHYSPWSARSYLFCYCISQHCHFLGLSYRLRKWQSLCVISAAHQIFLFFPPRYSVILYVLIPLQLLVALDLLWQ